MSGKAKDAMQRTSKVIFVFGLWVIVAAAGASPACAAVQVFSAGGDGVSWTDKGNWSPAGVPGAASDVTINLAGSAVAVSKDFKAQSVTVGGKAASKWTSQNFVYGTVAPAAATDTAVLIRKDGTVIMTGQGTVTLKGAFKNTEEALPTESSVMVLLL